MNTWQNYGDVNFMKYGGCLVKKDEYPDCFHVMWLCTEINNYNINGNMIPMIVAKCFINLPDWIKPEVNTFAGYEKDYTPQTLEEKMIYCTALINYYGIENFEPTFPSETGCTSNSLGTVKNWIVGIEAAKRFMKNYSVPFEYRH